MNALVILQVPNMLVTHYFLYFGQILDLSFWTTNDVDKILIEGDRIYKSSNTHGYLSAENLLTSKLQILVLV